MKVVPHMIVWYHAPSTRARCATPCHNPAVTAVAKMVIHDGNGTHFRQALCAACLNDNKSAWLDGGLILVEHIPSSVQTAK